MFLSIPFPELMMLTTMLPFIMAMKENPDMDIGQLMIDDDLRITFYESECYVSYVKKVLPNLLHSGYLDL